MPRKGETLPNTASKGTAYKRKAKITRQDRDRVVSELRATTLHTKMDAARTGTKRKADEGNQLIIATTQTGTKVRDAGLKVDLLFEAEVGYGGCLLVGIRTYKTRASKFSIRKIVQLCQTDPLKSELGTYNLAHTDISSMVLEQTNDDGTRTQGAQPLTNAEFSTWYHKVHLRGDILHLATCTCESCTDGIASSDTHTALVHVLMSPKNVIKLLEMYLSFRTSIPSTAGSASPSSRGFVGTGAVLIASRHASVAEDTMTAINQDEGQSEDDSSEEADVEDDSDYQD